MKHLVETEVKEESDWSKMGDRKKERRLTGLSLSVLTA